jgi:hypothetical protein
MTLQSLLDNPSLQVAFIVEIEYRDPDTDTITSVRYQTPNRNITSEGYAAYVLDPGDISYSVELDNLNAANGQGIASTGNRPCVLNNTPYALGDDGPLSYLRSVSLAGRSIIVYAGGVDDIFSSYEILSESTMQGEPVFDDGNNRVEISRESVLDRLKADIDIPSYVGEPGALRHITTSGSAAAADVAAHHVTEFVVAGRFRHPTTTSARFIFRRRLSATANNWEVFLSSTGILFARYSSGGVANALSISSIDRYDDGLFHTWVFGRSNSGHAYLMVNGSIVAESVSAPTPDTPASGIQIGILFDGPGETLDSRIYNKYIPPDEMRSAMLTRATGNESGLVGLYRGDDYTGSTLTDYSSTGADAIIGGTEGIDFDWVTSGLGGEQLAGQSMPCVIGSVYHWPADLVDSVLEVWRVLSNVSYHGLPTESVFDEGEELSSGVDYDWSTISSNLDALVYLLAGEAGEPLTARLDSLTLALPEEVFGPSAFSTIRETLLLDYGPLTSAELNTTPIGSLFPNDIGIYTRRQSLATILSDVVSGMGSYVVSNSDNIFRIDTIVPSVSPSPRDSSCLEMISTEKSKSYVKWSSSAGVIPTKDFTLAAWIKTLRTSPTGIGAGDINIMDLGGSPFTAPYVSWRIQTNSGVPKMLLGTVSPVVNVDTGFGSLLANPWDWWFVAVSHDDTSGETKFYAAKDGDALALIGTDLDLALSTAPGSNGVIIGGGQNHAYFRGSVVEPQIWNGIRTLAELQSSMGSPLAGNETDLLFYAPCYTLDAADLTDSISSEVGTVLGQVHQRPDLTIDLTQTPCPMTRRNLIPAKSIEVRYRKNYAVLSPSDIAATVTQEDALSLQKEYLSALWKDDEVGEDYKNARDIVVNSPFYDINGANALLRLLQYRYRPGGEIAEIADIERAAMLLLSGDEVRVIGHESDLENGKTYRVIGNHNSTADLKSDLVLVD